MHTKQLIRVTTPWLPAVVGGLLQIADGLLSVLTVGAVTTNLSGRWAYGQLYKAIQ